MLSTLQLGLRSGARRLAQIPSTAVSTGRRFCSTPAPKLSLWQRYNTLLEKYPLPVKMATSTVIAVLGDGACQVFIEGSGISGYSFERAVQIGAMGCILIGPVLHLWYGFLWRLLPRNDALTIVKRLVVDQLLFAPVAVASSLSFLAAAQGQASDIPRRLHEQVPGAVLNNWKLWPAAQAINFSLVPVPHQVLFANAVSVFWNGYLSWSANQEMVAQQASAAEDAALVVHPPSTPLPSVEAGK